MQEIEAKFLDIDKDKMLEKLKSIGATKELESDMRFVLFMSDAFHSTSSGSNALRLRDINGKSWLTFKGPSKPGRFADREEIEVEVSDFDKTKAIIEKMGFKATPIIIKHRIQYRLGDVHFELDQIEGENPWLEIEVNEEGRLAEIASMLGLDIDKSVSGTMFETFPHRFEWL